jgi:hypothetical protein
MMRPLLESTLGYQNPIYLVLRKTEQRRPILAAFLDELQGAHHATATPEPAKKPRKAAE